MFVLLQVLGQVLVFLGQDGDLDFGRAGICGVRLEFVDN